MNRLVDLNHVLERARVHGINATRLEAKTPTVSLHPCPACLNGYDALCEYDGFGVIPLCRGCEDGPAIAAALLADPPKPPASSESTFRLYTPGELLAMPAPVWLVEPFVREAALPSCSGSSVSTSCSRQQHGQPIRPAWRCT